MRKVRLSLAIGQVALLSVLAIVLRSEAWPLGVRGEWEWLRLARGPAWPEVALAALAVLAYAGFAALGFRFLNRRASRGREAMAVAGLLLAAVLVQGTVPVGAPEGYGLAKWSIVLHSPASTGYYTVARSEIGDAGKFLAAYPEWIGRQDTLHVGTHPPGLFLVEHALLQSFASRPLLARWVVGHLPASVEAGFRAINEYQPLPMADRAALGLTGALTLLACAATVVPLYVLARASLPAPAAWSSAAFWPVVPAAILFQPVTDTAFPFLATSALALAAHAGRSGYPAGLALAAASGLVLALGMAFTLAFLPLGLIVGIVLATAPGVAYRRRVGLLLATGAGFLVPTLVFWLATGANPFVIWWHNQRNHARFYEQYRRTYGAWVLLNPLELALALGIPASLHAIVGLFSARSVPRVAWATLVVLALLTFSGRNLSEVARLWLPFMPPLLTASGLGLSRLGGGPVSLGSAVALMGAETLLFQATIQVVYPI
jgi:hypothetical protein